MVDYSAGTGTVFSNPYAQLILSFLLVFTLVFAVLQKSKILGEGKKQIDALIALAVGLIVISVGYATDIITRIIPFLGVSLVIILVFMLLLGIFFKEGSFDIPSGLKIAFGIMVFIGVVIAVVAVTGSYGYIRDLFVGNTSLIANIIMIIVVIGAVALAVGFGGGKSEKKS